MPDLIVQSEWSLSRRLWLFLSLVLVAIVTAFGLAAYSEARNSALDAGQTRLASVGREVAAGITRGIVARLTTERRLAAHPEVQRLLVVPKPSPAHLDAVRNTLEAEYPKAVNILARRLVRTDGVRRFASGVLTPTDSVQLERALDFVRRTDSAHVAPIFARSDTSQPGATWVAVPVRAGTRLLGVLAHEVALAGAPNADRTFNALVGGEAKAYYAAADLTQWLAADGHPTMAPLPTVAIDSANVDGPLRVTGAEGDLMVYRATVTGAPWQVIVIQNENALLSGIAERGRRLAGTALVLMLIGMIGITVVARRETRSLEALRTAAVAMACGADVPRIEPYGAAETAALIRAFNRMAESIREGREALEARNVALEDANAAKERFLAVMSHELRTPLHAIAGHTELLALGIHGPITDAQRRTLERIERNNEQMLHLVNDVLHLSRPNGAQLTLEVEPVDIGELFDSVQANAAPRFADKGVTLVVNAVAESLLADRLRLQQVLDNLLTNALRFTEAGGEVAVMADIVDAEAQVTVRDTGIGISPEQRERIFEPFVQLDTPLSRRAGGAGLGLAIVKQLTEAMGGRVWVESEPGVGSAFTVAFPLADVGATTSC